MKTIVYAFNKKLVVLLVASLMLLSKAKSQYYPAGLPASKINLWLDANDTTTFTRTGDSISRWTDKANNLQAIAPSVTYNPLVNRTLLNGKILVEFKGVKALNIADNNLLDPGNGFHLAQVVYVHSDASTNYTSATDFRVGSYSRNENPNGINNGTASISIKYVTADAKYRLSLQRNSGAAVLGNGNNAFPDLSGTWNLLENYTTTTGTSDTTLVLQQNASAKITTPFTWYNSTQSIGIGNRFTNYASVHWSIGETILANTSLRNTGKNLLEVYLASKWGMISNLPTTLQRLYNAPSSTFTNNVLGIGYEGGTDSISYSASNNGLGFSNVNSISGFLREPGDYLIAGDNAASGTTALGANFTRWNRTWYIDKTDSVGFGGNVNLFFDFNAYGIANNLDTLNNAYYLLYNPTNATFNSGNNYIIPVTSYLQGAGTKQLSFLVDALNISDGYYTIVYAAKSAATSGIPLLTNFITPTIVITPAPFISSVYAGNTFNYVFINTDSIPYNVAYYKIYAATNGGNALLVDSIGASKKWYAHYNLVNGNSYRYFIKAGYAAGKESITSNNVTSIPSAYSPQWQTQPQYAGSGKLFMMAMNIGANAPVKYFFDCVSGGANASGYQATNSYNVSNLTNGVSYTFRFKLMDSIQGISTESGWSVPVSIFLADSAKGGFAYKFAFADNNAIAIPNGIGPTTYSATTIDTIGLRFIKHAPAFGVHPRIYCNPEDSTDIKWRLKNTASGRAVAKYIHAHTTMLQLGYPGFSLTANYAKDTIGNQLLGNPGYFNEKPRYDSLAAGDIGTVFNVNSGFNGYANKLANVMAYEAFECWLYKGTIDAVTNTSYTTRANRLANAITIWAKKALANTAKPVSFDTRDDYGSLQVAFIYDFLFDQMTQGQKDTVRMFVAALAPRDSSDLHLYNSPSYTTISNWSTFGWEIWNLLAIEGEAGYTQAHENLLQNYCRTVLNFLSYGFYAETGGPVEGIGKNQLNAPMLVALAKRGYSVLGHPAVKGFVKKYYPAIMQPFGYSMLGTDLLGGTGNIGPNNQYVSAAYGGWKHETSLDPIGFKWMFPNDTVVDFVWKNYIQKPCAGGATYPYTYYYQNFLGDASGHAGYWNFIHAAIFASDYSNIPFLTQAQAVYGNNKMYFDSLGGFATLRSGFDTLSSTLFFHNRTDLGGHTHANKNDIVYSALGRIWISRVFTNANSNYPLSSGTSAASSILINGYGQSVDTTTSQSLDILPVPGKILQYVNKPEIQVIAGDATEAYSYAWSYVFGGYTGDNPLLGGNYTKVLKTLNSFRYGKYYVFDDIPLYNKLTQGDYSWAAGPQYYRTVATPWLNGVINKAYRTVAMVTDIKPYVLVADDVQKGNVMANYKWLAQIANDLTIDTIVVNNNVNNYRNDFILKEPTATGNRRFLVRVLTNNGVANANIPAYIDSIPNPINGLTPNNKLPRLVIENNSIAGSFRVMLFAYNKGDSLPATYWNADRSKAIMVIGNTANTISFTLDSAGRTNINVQPAFMWTGAVDSNWNNSNNWTNNNLPTANDDAIIPITPKAPYVNGVQNISSMVINNGASVTVNGTLQFAGSINNNNGTFNALNATIAFNGASSQIIPANAFVNNTVRNININNNAGVTIAGVTNVTGILSPIAGTLTTNGYLTLKSSGLGTAAVATKGTSANIVGNVTVERFIAAGFRKRYVLITSPVSSPSIYSAWQEGGVNTNNGYGTQITGAAGYGVNEGFDGTSTSLQSSIFVYDDTRLPYNKWVGINNTLTNTLNAGKGFLLFIRGDRSEYRPSSGNSNHTILRANGSLALGSMAVTTPTLAQGNGLFNLVANPYASPINWSTLSKVNLGTTFYVYDPNLGSMGQFVTCDGTIKSPNVSRQHPNVIQSGQAFFIINSGNGIPSITFNETDKNVSVATDTSVITLGNETAGYQEIDINVYDSKTNDVVDGVVALFNEGYSIAAKKEDAPKFQNLNENFSLYRDGQLLSIEKHPSLVNIDTLFFHMHRFQPMNYELRINAHNFFDAHAILIDNYAKTQTLLNLSTMNAYPFTVTADSASSTGKRFMIVLKQPSVVATSDTLANASFNIHPNPFKDLLTVRWNNNMVAPTAISIVNAKGQEVKRLKGVSNLNQWTLPVAHLAAGQYSIRFFKGDKLLFSHKMIKE